MERSKEYVICMERPKEPKEVMTTPKELKTMTRDVKHDIEQQDQGKEDSMM